MSHLSVLNKRFYEEVLQHTFGFSDLERQKNITLETHCDTRNVGPTWPSWLRMVLCALAPLGLPLILLMRSLWYLISKSACPTKHHCWDVTFFDNIMSASCFPSIFEVQIENAREIAMQSSGVRVLRCSIYKWYKRQDLHLA